MQGQGGRWAIAVAALSALAVGCGGDSNTQEGSQSYSANELVAGASVVELTVTDRTIAPGDIDASTAGVLFEHGGGTAIWVLHDGELARVDVECDYVTAVAFADGKMAYSCSGTNVVIVADDGTTTEIGGTDGDQDGAGRAARLHDVAGLAFSSDGMLYVAERNKLRAVDDNSVAFTVYEGRSDSGEFRALKDVAADPNSTELLISDRFAVLSANPEQSLQPSPWFGNQDEYPIGNPSRHNSLLVETRGLTITPGGEVYTVSEDNGDLIAFIPTAAPGTPDQPEAVFTGAATFDVARIGPAGAFVGAYDVAAAPEGLLVAGERLWIVTPAAPNDDETAEEASGSTEGTVTDEAVTEGTSLSSEPAIATDDEIAALSEAESFLIAVGAGDITGTYQRAAQELRDQATAEAWAEYVTALEGRTGQTVSTDPDRVRADELTLVDQTISNSGTRLYAYETLDNGQHLHYMIELLDENGAWRVRHLEVGSGTWDTNRFAQLGG